MTESKGKDYAFDPIKYHVLINYYNKQKETFWIPVEIGLGQKDRDDWNELDPGTKKALTFVLAFFAQFDGIVGENLDENFMSEVGFLKEARATYTMFNAMETVHNEAYSLMIDTFIRDRNEQSTILKSIQNYPEVSKIASWIFRYGNPEDEESKTPRPFLERLLAFACLEGIVFSTAFSVIYYIKNKNILPGLTKANEWIARDEGLHTEFAAALNAVLTRDFDTKFKEIDQEKGRRIISSCIDDACKDFIFQALSLPLLGISPSDMMEYAKCTADKLSESFGFGKIYNTKNPFDWMLVISLPNKTNFFEQHVSEYSKEDHGTTFVFDLNQKF